MEALKLLTQLPATISEANHFSDIIINNVDEGDINPLDLIIQLKAIEKSIIKIKEATMDQAVDETNKHGRSVVYKSALCQIGEVGTKYIYSNCGDYKLPELINSELNAKKERVARELFLKSIKPENEIFDDEGTRLFAPIKTSKTIVKISLK